MPRLPQDSPLTDPVLRALAGKLSYAAAAKGLGGVWGNAKMEGRLGFRPTDRQAAHGYKGKKASSHHTCKSWLKGRAPQDRTLRLIAREHPEIAAEMRHWRDHPLVVALHQPQLTTYELVAAALTSEDTSFLESFALYVALGEFTRRQTAALCDMWGEKVWMQPTVPTLAATLLVERTIWLEAGPEHERDFDLMVTFLLEKLAPEHPPLAYCRSEFGALRETRRRPLHPRCAPSRPRPGVTILELDLDRIRERTVGLLEVTGLGLLEDPDGHGPV